MSTRTRAGEVFASKFLLVYLSSHLKQLAADGVGRILRFRFPGLSLLASLGISAAPSPLAGPYI